MELLSGRNPCQTRLPLVAALVALGFAAPVSAQSFDLGPFEARFSSNISIGASWRVESPNNGLLAPGNTADGKGRASSSTADDGNLNYDRGDLFSLQFRGIHDLELTRDNYGFFTRLKYWYDHEVGTSDVPHGHAANGYTPNRKLDTSDFERLARYRGIEFLDYYLFGSFDVGNSPLELRAGNMVLSWGESTFIQNGVNVINPFDVTALRKPGSEIKEALLPVGMVYANYGVTGDLSLEAFVQYDWERTILDECGTYWNAADPYGGGCNYLTISNAVPDGAAEAEGLILPRSPDQEASDSGQYGLAARYYSDAMNGIEFGLYYMNYHSRTPIFSANNATVAFGFPVNFGANPDYFFEFPEDIELWGLTFATNIGDWAVSGELSHRPDFPLQINTTDLLQAVALGSAAEWSRMLPRTLAAGPGGYVSGYDDVSYTQAQMTFIKFFEQMFGAQRLSLAAEVGAVFLGGMDDGINYGRSPSYGVGDFEPFSSEFFLWPGSPVSCNSHPAAEAFAGIRPNSNDDYCTSEGFTEDFSWGYRVRASLEYTNVFAGINLTPNVAWSHDVKGTSPAPNFVEDRIALSMGVIADYLNVYRADISYTSFFGADYDELIDRDFVSLSFSIAF